MFIEMKNRLGLIEMEMLSCGSSPKEFHLKMILFQRNLPE